VHRRRAPRLRAYDYATPGAYFVTVCTSRRGDVLGSVEDGTVSLNALGVLVAKVLAAVPEHFHAAIDTSIVMPDHLHAVLVLDGGAASLSTVVGNVKAAVARETRQTGLWQRGFHDHVIRDDDDLRRVREYVADNPRRWAERRRRV
jgi:REP element-mobilizing transposase RayT